MSRSSWKLPRRLLLHGAGLCFALPFLEQMRASTAEAQASGPRRFLAFFKANGTYMPSYLPAETGASYALTPTLQPLAPFKQDLTLVSGLQNQIAQPSLNAHMSGVAAWLTAVNPQSGMSISIDQVIAEAIRTGTTFGSLELAGKTPGGGLAGGTGNYEGYPKSWGLTNSFGVAGVPRPTEVDPQAAFDRLFADVSATPPSAQPGVPTAANPDAERRRLYRTSVLDTVLGQATALNTKLGASDQQRMNGYLEAVRDLERRLQAATPGGGGGGSTPAAGCSLSGRPGAGLSYPDRVRAMLDTIVLAFQCDRTRVITFMAAEAESENPFAFLNIRTPSDGDRGHHGASHYGASQELIDSYRAIDLWYAEQLAYLLGKLKAVTEPGGSLLDNSLVYSGSEMADGDEHSFQNMPVLLAGKAGGALSPGRHIAITGERPLADLYVTFMQMFGVTQASFGNSTGAVNLA